MNGLRLSIKTDLKLLTLSTYTFMNTHSKNGHPTAYGFACGYTQLVETETLQKELYKEYNTYHVRSTRNSTPELNTQFDGRVSHWFIVWESFYTLKEAKSLFNKIK